MKWENLLSLKRHGDNLKRLRSEQDNTRVGFDVDYDRIVFSSFFRSLQDKTQVIPFSKTSFVHTRLTHSLEVSVVGRSLGRIVGKHILNKHPYLNQIHGYQINDFGSIVAAASLAHDIGNPPFGHSGESAIGDFYKIGDGLKYKSQLTDLQYNDLCTFEGNANGFKILTESKPGSPGGLRLSYATLGAFTKYPKSSLPHKPTKHIKDKKYGYFSSQSDFFDEVATELGLKSSDNQFSRHPLTYLVEAADDICYTLIDFEDGINLDWIPEEFALEFLVKLVSESIDRKKYNSMGLKSQRIAYLRALAINTLINEAVNIFIENEDKILKGELETSLMSLSKYKSQMESIIEISIDKVYKSKEVIEKELTGYKVLNFLLKTFTSSVINWREDKVSAFDELALECIPKEYLNKDTDLYSSLLDVSCFIASLTDGLALEWYKKTQLMNQEQKDHYFMEKALQEAKVAFEKDEVPVGAIIVSNDKIIARSHNLTETLNDVTAHAEMQAITSAANYIGGKYLNDCTMYVTLEPCQMCAGAMYWAQLSRLVYGASDPHRGFKVLGTKIHPKTKVTSGVMSKESKLLIDAFFIKKRKEKQD